MDEKYEQTLPLHASAVSYKNNGVLIIGPSGSGKSELCAELLALGAELIGDDHITLFTQADKDGLWAKAPDTLKGLIELRYIGIIKAKFISKVQIHLVINLAQTPQKRMPNTKYISLIGQNIVQIDAKGLENMGAKTMLILNAISEYGNNQWRV